MSTNFVNDYLLFQLAVVSNNFSLEFHEFLRSKNMSKTAWRILINLVDRPGLYLTDLAKNTLLEQSHVTKITDQLCKQGLVEKITDATDRRRVNVRITKKGKNTILPLIAEAKKHEEKKLAQLPAEDAKQLKSILATLAKPHIAGLMN